MLKIDKLIADVIQIEAGYVDHPNDRGGPTKYGITLKTLDAFTGRKNTATDIKKLNKLTAARIYKKDYYLSPGIDKLPDILQAFVFDMAVNHGPKTAVKLLQLELIKCGLYSGALDGCIGPKSIAAAKRALGRGWFDLINGLVDRRIAHYRSIINHDKSQAVFERGWIARAESFRENIA